MHKSRMLSRFKHLLRITRATNISRRYFVTNGFDGALAMLGLNMGFYYSQPIDIQVALSACIGTAIALMMSGFSSAYISESAERQKELRELESAMVKDLHESDYGEAARYVPVIIALVNGLSPLLISLVVVMPLFVSVNGVALPFSAVESAVVMAFLMVFLLGVYSSRISGRFWLWTGLRAILVAVITMLIIWLTRYILD